MSELSYKELQEKGIFDVPYRAFEYMQSQQAEINELKWMLKNANGQADDFCKKSIELQKRIDELNQDQQVTIDDLRRAKAECIKFTNRVDELHDNIKL